MYDTLERRVGGPSSVAAVFVNESDVLPGWFAWFNYGTIALSIGLALASVILLTRPPSNDYFRGPSRPALPGHYPAGYPAAGGYPPAHQPPRQQAYPPPAHQPPQQAAPPRQPPYRSPYE